MDTPYGYRLPCRQCTAPVRCAQRPSRPLHREPEVLIRTRCWLRWPRCDDCPKTTAHTGRVARQNRLGLGGIRFPVAIDGRPGGRSRARGVSVFSSKRGCCPCLPKRALRWSSGGSSPRPANVGTGGRPPRRRPRSGFDRGGSSKAPSFPETSPQYTGTRQIGHWRPVPHARQNRTRCGTRDRTT